MYLSLSLIPIPPGPEKLYTVVFRIFASLGSVCCVPNAIYGQLVCNMALFSYCTQRYLNLLDWKRVRTWCRMREIGIKMCEACWIIILWCILLVADGMLNVQVTTELLSHVAIWACNNAFTFQESHRTSKRSFLQYRAIYVLKRAS